MITLDLKLYTCPVCGFDMPEPASSFNICSCCGTEFEYSDDVFSHASLRAIWIRGGCRWWSEYTPEPQNWNAQRQLKAIEGRHIRSWKDEDAQNMP